MKRAAFFLSHSTCPWFNLAYENWLFTTRLEYGRIMFVWRNTPCIVIGRNQIPWLEADVLQAERLGVPIIRRFSGGGTVYHDLGNALYSFICPSAMFSRQRAVNAIAQAMNKNGVPITANSRHDLLLEGKKVSGSAFRITRDRAYHHGTMLMASDLGRIAGLLRSNLSIEGATVSSVPSQVTNVPGLDMAKFAGLMRGVLGELTCDEEIDTFTVDEPAGQGVAEDMALLKDWEWTFGKGPKFKVNLPTAGPLTIEHGRVAESKDLTLIGARFDTNFIKPFR